MKVDCGYTENYLKEQNRMTGNCEIGWDKPYEDVVVNIREKRLGE